MARLYVVRHAKAEDGAPDEERRLAPRGIRNARAMGERLAAAGVAPEQVVHSGLVRARETADLLVRGMGTSPARFLHGLAPWDDPSGLADWIRSIGAEESRMLVSHQPFCGLLTGWLTGCGALAIPTCTVVCLEREGAAWLIRWIATPDSP